MPGRALILRLLLVAPATLLALVAVLAPTLALTAGYRDSDVGLKFWPFSASAQARKADELIATDLNAPTLARADALSRSALRREPINVAAARVQAIIAAARDQDRAAIGWLSYAESLSRRDLAVQAMLIEASVARGNVASALIHYDRALRTNKVAGDLLFPILFDATKDPNVLPLLANLLGKRPEWWYDFTVRWQNETPAAVPLFKIATAERLNPDVLRERLLAMSAMQRMVLNGRVDLAVKLHDQIVRADAPKAGNFVDGNFDAERGLPPFAWDFANEAGLVGIVERRNERNHHVLTIDVSYDRSGVVAKQIVRLQPGSYRLNFSVGDVGEDGIVPVVSVMCIGAPEPLAEQRLAPASIAKRSVAFQVDRGCPAQTISIGGAAGVNNSLPLPWIAKMRLTRVGG